MKKLNMGALCAFLAAAGMTVRAEDQMGFKFSGFGTLAATTSSEKNADFIPNFMLPNGPGNTKTVDFGADSRLGVQFDLKFNDTFSAVGQVVLDHRYDNSYTPYLNMANIKAQLTPDLSLRVGRVPFSAYLISDYRMVGYSMPWARPPVEIYQFNPITSLDGGDVSYRHTIGEVAFCLQVSAGSSKIHLAGDNATAQFTGSGSALSLLVNRGSSTFRAYYTSLKCDYNSIWADGPEGPFAFLRNPDTPYGPNTNPYYNPALADQYQLKKKTVTYTSLGYTYDPGTIFVTAEVARNAGDQTMLTQATAGYITCGYHMGEFTPYATVAKRKNDSIMTNANPIVEGLLASTNQAQSSVSAGLRWDFRAGMSLKGQVDRVKNAEGSFGALTNTQPAFVLGGSYTVSTIALDFVF